MSSHSQNDLDSLSNDHVGSSSETDSTSDTQTRLHNLMDGLTCTDRSKFGARSRDPYLLIVEQPQMNFRFRYKSEMSGTHGCLLGKNSLNKKKTHPGVELRNYTGRARIKCRLVQVDRDEEHPHKLQVEEEDLEGTDISGEVGPGGYSLMFPDMGIIYTAKKYVAKLLYQQKFSPDMNATKRLKLAEWAKNETKRINLNIVRLRFSAHHIETDEPIPNCKPVYSTPIHNMKSAETNEPKICRMDRVSGSVGGNDDIYILVEKVSRKNIRIQFVEVDELTQGVVWTEWANFTQADVHHQFAIVFKTPPYRNLLTPKDVTVYVQLFRPSDGRTSERIPFLYKADPSYANRKKRKASASLSSLSSLGSSAASLTSSEIPLPVLQELRQRISTEEPMVTSTSAPTVKVTLPGCVAGGAGEDMLADALYLGEHRGEPMLAPALQPAAPCAVPVAAPDFSVGFLSAEFNKSDLIDRALLDIANSGEFAQAVANLSTGPYTEYREYMESQIGEDCEPTYLSGITTHLQGFNMEALKMDAVKTTTPTVKVKVEPYSQTYDTKSGNEISRLVSEFCDLLKNKTKLDKRKVTDVLRRIMSIRLSNGDTFLHMLVGNRLVSTLEYIVVQIHSLGLHSLLNIQNEQSESILHLAIKYDMHDQIALLCENVTERAAGCDAMLQERDGNTAAHLAVLHSERSLLALLKYARRQPQFRCTLDVYNNGQDTALLLAARYGRTVAARALLAAGASSRMRDAAARLPLHLAVSGDHVVVTGLLLQRMDDEEVDLLDSIGNTALQIACSGELRPNTLEIVKLLLDKGASPLKQSGGNSSPLKLAYNEKQLLALLQKYVGQDVVEIKSEPEEDTAEESSDDECDDPATYASEVAAILDSGERHEMAPPRQTTRPRSPLKSTLPDGLGI